MLRKRRDELRDASTLPPGWDSLHPQPTVPSETSWRRTVAIAVTATSVVTLLLWSARSSSTTTATSMTPYAGIARATPTIAAAPLPRGAVVPLPAPLTLRDAAGGGGTNVSDRRCPQYDAWLGSALDLGLRFAPVVSELASTASSLCLLDPVDFAVAAVAIAAAPLRTAIYIATPTAPEGPLLALLLRRNRCAGAPRAKYVANPAVAASLSCDVSIVGAPSRWSESMARTGYGSESRRHVVFASSVPHDRVRSAFVKLASDVTRDVAERHPWASASGGGWLVWPSSVAAPLDGVVVLTRISSPGPPPAWMSEATETPGPSTAPPRTYDPENASSVTAFLAQDPAIRYSQIANAARLIEQFRADGETEMLMRSVARQGARSAARSHAIDRVFERARDARSVAFRHRLAQLQYMANGDGGHGASAGEGLSVQVAMAGLRATLDEEPRDVECEASLLVTETGCTATLITVAARVAAVAQRGSDDAAVQSRMEAITQHGDAAPSHCVDLCWARFVASARPNATPLVRPRADAIQRMMQAVSGGSAADAVSLATLQRARTIAVVGCDPWWLSLAAMAASASGTTEGSASVAFWVAAETEDGAVCDMSAFAAEFPRLTPPTPRPDIPATADVLVLPALQIPKLRSVLLPRALHTIFATGADANCVGVRTAPHFHFACVSNTHGVARWIRTTEQLDTASV